MRIKDVLEALRSIPYFVSANPYSMLVSGAESWETIVAEYPPRRVDLATTFRQNVLVIARATEIGDVTLILTPHEYAEWVGAIESPEVTE